MRSPKDFFRPLAVGAPEPVREIPFPPSRMIHFFPASNPKMVAKVPDMATKVDVLLANLEDGVPATDKEAARAGLVEVGKAWDPSVGTQLWTRVNSLDSPWALDDLTAAVTEIGDRLDVIMIPKVEGPEDIHYVDRLVAQLEAKRRPRPGRCCCTPSSRPPGASPTSRRSARPAPACRACRSARPTWPPTAG